MWNSKRQDPAKFSLYFVYCMQHLQFFQHRRVAYKRSFHLEVLNFKTKEYYFHIKYRLTLDELVSFLCIVKLRIEVLGIR